MSNAETGEVLEAIAVVGLSGRFPGAKNPEEFWRNLRDGVESISFFSAEEMAAAGVAPELIARPDYVNAHAVLDGVELFDAEFFGFSPREAEITDPQHRLFLETMWQALETAGYDSSRYPGHIAVFAGTSLSSYLLRHLYPNREVIESFDPLRVVLGNDKDHMPTWAAYKLNLKGPSVNVQTACSTSLVAVHLACQSLLNYQCDIALAGGVTVDVPQQAGYIYKEGGINSPDGHCRAFDAEAKGAVSGNGVGVVVLKRLSDALADGDSVEAVILGSAVNNDGAQKIGYTAPSAAGQAEVIALAQAVAGVEPESISYVEAHGSATALGDPIEVEALTQVFRAATARKNFVALGAVKTNIGHVGSAAGVAGLIKTVLALKHRMLPPSLHFRRPNPQIDFADSPFYVNAELKGWESPAGPRRAGVSSFGVGGTNAHLVLEEAPEPEASGPSRPRQTLLLSAATPSALEAATDNLAAHLREHAEQNLADVAYTLKVGRKAFAHRRMLVCRSHEEAASALSSRDPKRVLTRYQPSGTRSVAFMFPGLGDHYVGMALGLYQSEPAFREELDRCCELLEPHAGLDLRTVLYPAGAGAFAASGAEAAAASDEPPQTLDLRKLLAPRAEADEATRRLNRTHLTQPALFAVEYALARLWMSWGVEPEAMIGYSLGEYVAACLAGVFTLEDALLLVARRAKLIQSLPAGSMLAVPLPEAEVAPLLDEGLDIAGVNGPSLCVVSGRGEAVAGLAERLAGRGVACRGLQTTHAFHSRMMGPIAGAFGDLVATLRPRAPRIPFVSNVTGTWITAAEATDAAYWVRHLLGAVRFSEGVKTLRQQPGLVLLEVGPGQLLSSLAIQHAGFGEDAEPAALASLRHLHDRQDDQAFLLRTMGQLWLAGVELEWEKFYAGERRRRVALPTYPFERKRYWVDARPPAEIDQAPRANAARKPDVADWFYIPSWRRTLLPRPAGSEQDEAGQSRWLVLGDEDGLGARLARRLSEAGSRVVTLLQGEQFARVGEGAYTFNPARFEEYAAFVEELSNRNHLPTHVVHLWGVAPPDAETRPGAELFEKAQAAGFNSLLYLAQAVAERSPDAAAHIAFVTSGAQDVGGEAGLSPEKVTALIPCRVIPQVYPRVTCRSVDIVVPARDGRQEEWLLGSLLRELSPDTAGQIIAYRERHRWTLEYRPARAEPGGAGRLRQGGVYLITGGLSGVGPQLCAHLARAARAKLILLDDRENPPLDEIRRLEELGAEIEIIEVDVANEAGMRAAVARTYERFGALHGVFHTAAVREAEGAQNFQIKVHGAYVLEKVLEGRAVDFVLLLSSLEAVAGRTGSMPHAAANLFLNAFAQAQSRRDGNAPQWFSVNWDDATTADEAEEVWRHVLASEWGAQVAVSAFDMAARAALEEGGAAARGATEARGEMALYARPNTGVPYVAPSGLTEETVAGIWQKLLGIEAVGSHDNFFQLGGNSLLGIQLTSQLRQAFQVDIPVHAIFAAPTVGELAAVVEDMILTEIEGSDETDEAHSAAE